MESSRKVHGLSDRFEIVLILISQSCQVLCGNLTHNISIENVSKVGKLPLQTKVVISSSGVEPKNGFVDPPR